MNTENCCVTLLFTFPEGCGSRWDAICLFPQGVGRKNLWNGIVTERSRGLTVSTKHTGGLLCPMISRRAEPHCVDVAPVCSIAALLCMCVTHTETCPCTESLIATPPSQSFSSGRNLLPPTSSLSDSDGASLLSHREALHRTPGYSPPNYQLPSSASTPGAGQAGNEPSPLGRTSGWAVYGGGWARPSGGVNGSSKEGGGCKTAGGSIGV